jgi:hypothetical protein
MNPVPAQEPREPDQHSEWLSSNLGSPLDQQSEDDEEPTGDAVRLKGHFTSSDLLNPSDALDWLMWLIWNPRDMRKRKMQKAIPKIRQGWQTHPRVFVTIHLLPLEH